jgi:hypothetical protein
LRNRFWPRGTACLAAKLQDILEVLLRKLLIDEGEKRIKDLASMMTYVGIMTRAEERDKKVND